MPLIRGTRRAWLAPALVLAISLALTGLAQAHSQLLRSVPEANGELALPPGSIEMWFSEALEPGYSGARLLTSTGQELTTGAAVVDPTDSTHLTLPVGRLEPGIYTVAYQTLSQVDGHAWQGSFPFTVLNPDGSRPTGSTATTSETSPDEFPSPGEIAARWLALLGSVLFLGIPLFERVVVAGEGKAPAGAKGEAGISLSLSVPALWLAGLAIAVGNGLPIVLRALQLGGLSQAPELAIGTRPAALALARQTLAFTGLLVVLKLPQPSWLRGRERWLFAAIVICLAGLLILLTLAATRGEGLLLAVTLGAGGLGLAQSLGEAADDTPHDRKWEALILLAAAALLGHSASSHAAAVPGSLWAILADYVHLLAASAWTGGLLLLPWVIGRARRASAAQRLAWPPMVRRFSYLASFAIFLLVVTGLFNSLVQIPNLDSLFNTAYGRVLLLKLALMAGTLGLAFLNNRLVHGPVQNLPEADRGRTLNRQVTAEAALALGLMASVAVLVQTPSPRAFAPSAPASASLPFNATVSADDLYMHVQVDPNQVGRNRFWLHLYHEAGTPIGDVQLVRLLFNYREADLGQASADLKPLGADTYQVEGAYLNQAGVWDISVYVRRRGLDDALTRVSLSVPPPASPTAVSNPWQNPIPTLPIALHIAGVLATAGLVPLVWRRPLESIGGRAFPLLQLAGAVLLLGAFVFGVIALASLADRLSGDSDGRNPIPVTAASLSQGQAKYTENCLPCHGASGKGDGPLAPTLRPPPANLQVHMVPGVHTDAQLFQWISDGYPNSRMPAFSSVLTKTDRWNVVNYIRTLAPH